MTGEIFTVAEGGAGLPIDMRALLHRISLLRRYDPNVLKGYGPSTHLTLNVPRDLLEQIDQALLARKAIEQ